MTVLNMLQRAHSARTRKLAAMLKAGNPLDKIVSAFKMVEEIIKEEEKEDDEKLSWCDTEREDSHAILADAEAQITTLEDEINTLEDTIGAPETGLVDMLAEAEETKATNYENQVDETKERTKENLAYQEDIKNLSSAQEILKKAIKVLDDEVAARFDALQVFLGPPFLALHLFQLGLLGVQLSPLLCKRL
jgi:chromosome segregation ATPase